ncbi:MAG: IS5 family transposase [Nanoarchaeota archaeon]|nr:IS5 family transposase [Nanoarchaeota archaeon]MBU1444743.1 IS5 family transposase [Nanoarchaeota archaeon]
MKKEIKLVKKVKRLLKRLRCPRFLHRFGPKIYELYEHLLALLIRHFCKLSYRRVVKLLDLFGIRCPSKSALQYTAKKLPTSLWNKAIELTSGGMHYIVAIDSTGISRTNPSYHYLRRINGQLPKIPVKLSTAFDTRKKKFCAGKVRVLPAHDIKDIKFLLKQSNPNILVADKAYDANWVHEFCFEHNIEAHIPLRNYGKPKHKNMSFRMMAAKKFRKRTYNRRSLAETGMFCLKQKYGSSVSSKSAKTIKADLYGRMLCHNLFGAFRMI